MTRSTIISIIFFFIAIGMWVAVWYSTTFVEKTEIEHAGLVARAQELALKDASLSKLRSLLTETKSDRDAINTLIPGDVITIVDSIDTTAREAGIPIKISNAVSVGAAKKTTTSSVVEFAIQADGTYTQVTHLAQLLSTLPNPSVIQEISLSNDKTSAQWHMILRIRMLVANQT